MKKLLLSFALAFAALVANGQTLSQLWYYEATTTATELLTTTSASYSLAYNKSTERLYVANRGDKIYIINPDTYTGNITSIAKAGLPTLIKPASINESFCFSKVRVDDNGVIYATAMQTNGIIYIYRWANEAATPTKTAITDASITDRVGDSFGLHGTGNNTRLYVAGNSTGTSTGSKLYVINVIDGVPEYHGAIDLNDARFNDTFRDIAKGSISPEAADVLWLGSTDGGVTFRRVKINLTTNAYVSHEIISSSFANSNTMVGEYVADEGKRYFLAASGRTAANQNLVHLSTSGAVGAATVTMQSRATFNFSKTSYTTNFGYSDVAFKKNADLTHTFYVLTSQNFLGAVKTSVPLPVSLTSFDAALVKGQSTLTWETASETNNSGFEVLRSTDGKDFTKIHFENSKGQNGNSTAALKYSFVDRTAKAGVNYYQLKQIDLNGDNELFKDVKSVNVSLGAADVVVFPNPATTYISVNAGGADFKDVKYELFDASGKIVLSEKATAEQQDISLSKLPASIYFLKISKNGALQKTVKLVKQ
ncbi:MAG: T9SS type A sorting domain-containing protein [Pedobacter sp.]